jgi:MinD superfamily P-loop ATPase
LKASLTSVDLILALVEPIFSEAHHTIQLLKFLVIKASSIEGKLDRGQSWLASNRNTSRNSITEIPGYKSFKYQRQA